MSVQMALAEASHHTAPRGQRIARAREEEREVHNTAAFRTTVPPPEPELFDLFEEPGGGRPSLLLEPQGPQAGVQRHTMEHIADVVPMVQVLDLPVPQGAGQLVEVWRHLDFLIPEQVIEVPKISLDKARRRMADFSRPPQTAEQLVDVPTIISCSSLQRTVEQSIAIPVPQVRGGGCGGLQGFRPGQGTPAAGVEQIVDFPVPQRRRKRSGGFQGFLPGQYSTADVEQNVDIPARGGFHGFLPGQGFSSSSRFPRGVDARIQGGFRTFSRPGKSAELGPHSGSQLGADFTSWTLAAYAESMAGAYDVVTQSEAVAVPVAVVEVEDAAARLAAGFRPMRVCMQFLKHQLGWPGRGCAYGSRCTFAHSWAELHPEASAHEQQLASHFPR